MPNRIIPKKSSVAAKVPLATDLSVGEIAINLVDKKIYSKDSGGTVIELANGTVTSVGGTGTVSGLTLSGSVTTSGNLTLGGTLTLTSGQVTTALGYTPYNSTNPSGYITSSGSITGSAATLTTGRTIGMTGDVTWTSASFNGSANVTGTATLANSGVTAGTYRSVTVDVKGRVTGGTNPTTLSGYGITDAASSTHDHLGLLHRNSGITDFNNVLTEGTYGAGSGTSLTNAPYTGGIYGKLVVTVNDGGTHNNSNNWIWQVFDDTSGRRYSRYKVNAGAWTVWVHESTGSAWQGNAATATTASAAPWSGITSKPTTLSGYGITDALPISGGNLTGGLKEARVAMGANDVNLNSGNYFTKTISGATTFTVSNTPASGTAAAFILDLTNGGSGTITWWSGMKWAAGTAPTLTASGRDVLAFFTHDGGTTWSGFLLGKDVK